MTDQWLVYTPTHGTEAFRDYRHFIRRFRQICAREDHVGIQVQLPATVTLLERMIIENMVGVRRPRSGEPSDGE